MKLFEASLRRSRKEVKGVSRCFIGVVSPYVYVSQHRKLLIQYQKNLLGSKAKEGDSPVFENIEQFLVGELEYGGTREILSESAATMR